MKETCLNCSHYHGTLSDATDVLHWHMHNYCDVWKTQIPIFTIFDRKCCISGYDDLECGLAYCWCFEPGKEWTLGFENMEDNKVYKDEGNNCGVEDI